MSYVSLHIAGCNLHCSIISQMLCHTCHYTLQDVIYTIQIVRQVLRHTCHYTFQNVIYTVKIV